MRREWQELFLKHVHQVSSLHLQSPGISAVLVVGDEALYDSSELLN
jgi:hypothetical protein